MSLTTQRLLAALGLLAAHLGGCASRQVPTNHPKTSAASASAKQGSPADLNEAFKDDMATESSGSDSKESRTSAQPKQEHHHGHH